MSSASSTPERPGSQDIAQCPKPDNKGESRWRAGTLVYTSAGLATLFCWLLWGDFAWQLKERSAQPVMQIMLRGLKASDAITGFFLLSLPALIGLFLVPIISYRSDNHRGRRGRRIPYLLIPTPIVVLSMIGLAFSPAIGAWLHSNMGWSAAPQGITTIIVMGLFWTSFEFATLAANAVFGGLINDVVPREMIGRFFGMFRVVSLLTGIFFNKVLIGHVKENYTVIFVTIGLVYGAGFILMCVKVKEGEYPPPATAGPGEAVGFVAAAKSYTRDCFSRSYYIWTFASMALAALAFTPVNIFSLFAAQSFGMSDATYGNYLAATYLCSLCLAYPLGWMADKFHATRMAIAAIALYAVFMGIGYFGITGPESFGLTFLAHGVLSGCYFTGAASLGQVLFPKMKFTQFAAAAGSILALCNIVAGPVLGRMLDLLGHDYRFTFGLGCLIGLLALFTSLVVYRRFLEYGGHKSYQAPE